MSTNAAAKLFPQQMAGGSWWFLKQQLGGRFVYLSCINSALPALITCIALPSGSGATETQGSAQTQAYKAD